MRVNILWGKWELGGAGGVHTLHLYYACRQVFMRVYIIFYMRLSGLWARGAGAGRDGYAA